MNPPYLEVDRLTVSARRGIVLKDMSFAAAAGTLTWIIGENGAGKSSLLRVLAMRAGGTGAVQLEPYPEITDITFYSPLMGVPANLTVASWLRFNTQLIAEDALCLGPDDPLLPAVSATARLTTLSTGEAKRLLLWSLLRVRRPFTFLDEPYEHLSPAAKSRLTDILVARAVGCVVVVATNQDVPNIPNKQIIEVGLA
ncbi:MAG: ABC transporter ATP-binding protein [Gemmatimonadota bacterium]